MKAKASIPVLTFRVYPEDKFLYAVVNIWPTRKAMYAHKPLDRNHVASCTGQTRIVVPPNGGRIRKRGEFAELNFYRGRLGVEVASHEFTHATFCWAERRNLNLNLVMHPDNSQTRGETLETDSVEEKFCYAGAHDESVYTTTLRQRVLQGNGERMSKKYPVINAIELTLAGRSKRVFERLKLACCDCGLLHDIAFAIEKNGNLGIALRRNNRATGQLRRRRQHGGARKREG